MARIPRSTPMSPALYGILQVYAYAVIDQFWETSISTVLAANVQPNMYDMMMCLYRAGNSRPAAEGPLPKRYLSEQFSQFWLGQAVPLTADGVEPVDAQVKRTAVTAVGAVYYDVVRTATDGNKNGSVAAPLPLYEEAVNRWSEKNATDLQQALVSLQSWIDSPTN